MFVIGALLVILGFAFLVLLVPLARCWLTVARYLQAYGDYRHRDGGKSEEPLLIEELDRDLVESGNDATAFTSTKTLSDV